MKNAYELAQLFIIENKPDVKTLNEIYNSGISASEDSFGKVFGNAAAEYAASFVRDNKDNPDALEIASKRLGIAILQLHDSHFSLALDSFISYLETEVPDFCKKTYLSDANREKIARSINDLDDCFDDKREVLIRVVSGFKEFDSKFQESVRLSNEQDKQVEKNKP